MEKGFTIIELIVVIAIIGVLGGITIASVSVFLGRGRDISVKGSLGQIAKNLQIYYSENRTYENYSISSEMPLPCTGTSFNVISDTSAYAVFAKLCTNNNYWCIDSSGKSVELSSQPSGTECAEPSCVLDCTGKSCGDDGCGGSCGTCPQGGNWYCDNAAYDCRCAIDCTNKCGGADDGCGGQCLGECNWDQRCYNGQCCNSYQNCSGRCSGDDGCGGQCNNTCPGDQYCDMNGYCQSYE